MRVRKTLRRILTAQLIAGVVIFIVMTMTLAEISEDVINREPLTVADAQIKDWLYNQRAPQLTRIMFGITFLGSTQAASLISVGFAIYLIWRRRFYWLAATTASVFGGMLLNRLLKYAFHRPRPFFTDPLLRLGTYSFPSGHTMTATVLYGVLAAYLCALTSDWRRRVLVVFAAVVVILLVAFSRMYLGAHFLSDVLAAMAEGLAWLSLCLTIVHTLWELRQRDLAKP